MPASYDVCAVGNAIVDVIAPADDDFLAAEGLTKGAMILIDDARADSLYGRMAAGIEASGGSAGNTVAGVASLGGTAAYLGKVAGDKLGEIFRHDITAQGVHFKPKPLPAGGPGTGRCLINVTPDGQRTMCTYLGAANLLTPDDVDADVVKASSIVYLEGYLFDPDAARLAFVKAARIARDAGRKIALTLSDAFVVDRHRASLLAFIDSEIDIVFANEAEACSLFQVHDFDTAASLLGARTKTACVTRGEHGSAVITGGVRVDVPAAPARQVLDTTGAGDQYAAGVMFGLARGLDPALCGRLGSIAAAEVIDHYGPRPQVALKSLAREAGII
jgi:sugar/nucleoside kinase (ribokinase family)